MSHRRRINLRQVTSELCCTHVTGAELNQPNRPFRPARDLNEMAYVYTLTTGVDTVAGSGINDLVDGTAETLNSGDSLTGGAGSDELRLSGSGTFRLDELATFTGF